MKRARLVGIMDRMELVLIAIGALGLLGLMGVLLLAKRLGGLQGLLSPLDRLDEIERRLGDLSAEFDRKELNTLLQVKMTEVTEANRRLLHSVGELRLEVQEIKDATAQRGGALRSGEGGESPSLDVIVRSHLASNGFTEVQLLSDLASLHDQTGRVVFEARRAGVMHKGHVNLLEGRVVDENVRAAYSAFP